MLADPIFTIEKTSYAVVETIWKSELWRGRHSPIEAHSAMCWLGGHDMNFMHTTATFWVARSTSQPDLILGVLSGHFGGMINGRRSYRTRGLWVSETMRRHGVARALIDAAVDQAKVEGCAQLWTFPRKSSIAFYDSVGFKRMSEWTGGGEFGPNLYALKTI